MLIELRIEILFTVGILLLYGIIHINASKQSQNKAEKLIRDICENLSDDDLYSEDNQRWENFCKRWIKSKDEQRRDNIQSENMMDEPYMNKIHQPRKFGFRSSSRASRSSSSRSSSSRTSGISSGSRTSSFATRYRSIRTGAIISRPTGWLWSRTRHVFLPVSRHYYYRSYSSSNRYTTPATGSETYYYCTSNSSISMEIQCSTTDGDAQCCEDETTQDVFCCGGKIEDDLVEDFNQATKILAQILYTLSAIALFMHIFMRRCYR